MNKVLRAGAREIIYKVLMRCLAEYRARMVLSELDEVYTRTADFTGVSESLVRKIVKYGLEIGGKFSTPAKLRQGRPSKSLDEVDVCAIRQKVHFFYTVLKEVPTLGKLLAYIRQDLGYDGSRDYLRKFLKKVGFRFQKCKTNVPALVEKPVIAHKREIYLQVIIDNRNLPKIQQKNIIYLDERYLLSNHKIKKCWQSINSELGIDTSEGDRWIIVLAGSEKGLVPNSVSVFSGTNEQEEFSEMNSSIFKKWVTEKVIPNITEPSIIVMDNAPYHCVAKNKAPTRASKVNEIKSWLLDNNVLFDPDSRKPCLIELVKRHKPDPVHEIDNVLSKHGHTVVRLPPYHCDLNPVELIWAQAKNTIASKNEGANDIKKLAMDTFNSITSEDWKICCGHVEKIEKEYYNRGRTLYDEIDKLIAQIGANNSAYEDTDSYSDEEAVLKLIKDNTTSKSLQQEGNTLTQIVDGSSSHCEDADIEEVEYLDFTMLD